MSEKKIVKTIHRKYDTYKILKVSKIFGTTQFYIYKDGKRIKGPYYGLNEAVEAAKKER